jgi:hypothetical protein
MKYLVEFHYGSQYYKELVDASSPFEALDREKHNAVNSLGSYIRELGGGAGGVVQLADLTSPTQFNLLICSEADEEDIAEWEAGDKIGPVPEA